MESKFSKKLIAEYVIYMKRKCGVVFTLEEASEHLDGLAELFLAFRKELVSKKNEQGFN
jgi:hypothetical protein